MGGKLANQPLQFEVLVIAMIPGRPWIDILWHLYPAPTPTLGFLDGDNSLTNRRHSQSCNFEMLYAKRYADDGETKQQSEE